MSMKLVWTFAGKTDDGRAVQIQVWRFEVKLQSRDGEEIGRGAPQFRTPDGDEARHLGNGIFEVDFPSGTARVVCDDPAAKALPT